MSAAFSVRTLSGRLALIGLTALVAWKALAFALGDLLPDAGADTTVTLDPGNSVAVLALSRHAASAEAEAEAPARALHAVRSVLATRPADGRLFRVLAQLDSSDVSIAMRRWQAAIQLRPADVEARVWLADEAVSRQDYVTAMRHSDAVLRVSPQHAERLFPIFSQWLEAGTGVQALGDTLQHRPPWRRSFIDYVARTGDEKSLYPFAQVLQTLRGGPAPADQEEARPIVNRLVVNGDFELAYLLWRTVVPPVAGPASMLYNGSFALPATGAAFDWTLRSTIGAAVSVEADGPDHPDALCLRFQGGRVAEIGVGQILLLPPGTYRIAGQVRQEDMQSPRGLEWRLDCLGETPHAVGSAILPNGTQDWGGFAFDVTVPAQDCRAQRLQLATRARIPAEQDVDGSAWFDNLSIDVPPAP